MKLYPRGSEWRKWDLHVHAPGTKLNNGYGDEPDWNRFCRALEESDVAAVGIADYFSADGFIAVSKCYQDLYPDTEKVLFPNIELRLNETVNGSNQDVNIHLIFRPEVPHEVLDRFLGELKTEISDGNDRKLSCKELLRNQFMSATVTRRNIETALNNTFGNKSPRSENAILIVPANNDGIRPASGAMRKANLADEIDKFVDAVFGNTQNINHFLRTDRFEDKAQTSTPKPVLAGSDAHSFEDLESWLGKEDRRDESRKQVTWIKADPTFEGLQQTLVEPEQRVLLQPIKPDAKEPYQYISTVRFVGASDDFPEEIHLNQNLVSIIGARSSGKSALLAYIAHSVDPEHVVAQQVATKLVTKETAGPAAGKTWASVKSINCRVEWGDSAAKVGKVIYVPQNSLYAISERPEEITAKIQPALYRIDPDFAAVHRQTLVNVQTYNDAIRAEVAKWFEAARELSKANGRLRDLGDKEGIASTRNSLAARISALRKSSALTPEETTAYQQLVSQLALNESRTESLESAIRSIEPYLSADDSIATPHKISARIEISPSPSSFPGDLEKRLNDIVESARGALAEQVVHEISSYRTRLRNDITALKKSADQLRATNNDLIERSQAHTELDSLIQKHQKQEDVLRAIAAQEAAIVQLAGQQEAHAGAIGEELAKRRANIDSLCSAFSRAQTQLDDGMSFGLEHEVTEETLVALSRAFNLRDIGDYVDRESQRVKVEFAQDDPRQFLLQLYQGGQKLKRGENPAKVAADVLAATAEVRFYATLDGDRIGGFRPSSMTPGKQALFALTLILDESPEAWPLLIDQPEDDLDSRSVYEHIVPYLLKRKIERQILMVSHNANLVVGADSEQIIVANRHGDDRRNEGNRTFDYMTGAIEHSEPTRSSRYVLHSCGIREHACEILDGGEEAFRKRGSKYKV
jgi:hypothetical protein